MEIIKRLILGALFVYPSVAMGLNLKSGDIVLLPLNCRSCDVIASETGGSFSHSGIYLKNDRGEEFVIEALGKVRAVDFKSFIKRAPSIYDVGYVRVKELEDVTNEVLFNTIVEKFQKYMGKGFDHHYLWDNTDENGDELYYCSEFVAKLLNELLINKFQTAPMDFTTNWDYWYRAFDGEVPQGKPGNSPNDLYRDSLVTKLR